MSELIEFLYFWVRAVMYIIGVFIAKGFWLTVWAICFPPYAYYLFIDWLIKQ